MQMPAKLGLREENIVEKDDLEKRKTKTVKNIMEFCDAG